MDSDCEQVAKILHIFRDFYFIFTILEVFVCIKKPFIVFTSGIPRDISFTVVQETFNSVEGIVAVHNLRIWGLTTDKTALAAHLVIGKL